MLVPFKAGFPIAMDNNYLKIRLAALHKNEIKNEIKRRIIERIERFK